MITLEDILDPGNLEQALRQVAAGGGSPGTDGMTERGLRAWLRENWAGLKTDILARKYVPPSVRMACPGKEGKKTGKGQPDILTLSDRFVEQAVAQVLTREYDPFFSPGSHGFRPGRDCRTALSQLLEDAGEGYEWVVDLELKDFFDSINHAKILQLLSERIRDGRVISLIHRMMRAPISEKGKLSSRTVGIPQKGCVSQVLSDILLNEFDQELTRRGHRFVRYAQDCLVLCRSRKAAERTLISARSFLEKKLFLTLNEEKTRVCLVTDPKLKFLGAGFRRNPETGRIDVRMRQKS